MQEPWQVSTNPRERLINASIAVKQKTTCSLMTEATLGRNFMAGSG
jgi:hypothetical protein